MRVLVDTHAWLWMQIEPERFGVDTLSVLEDERNDLLLSAASSWEIAIKHARGRLRLPEPPASYVPSRMMQTATTGLAVEHAHALRVAELPLHHRDPFDRLLIAQAQIESVPVVTSDRQFAAYDVPIIWAS